MQCSYHPDRAAIGSCKSCGRDLCAECAVDLGGAYACRGTCESDVPAKIMAAESKARSVAAGLLSLLLLLGAIASLHISTMDSVRIHTGSIDEGTGRMTIDKPRVQTLSKPDKTGYAIFGVVLLGGSVFSFVVFVRRGTNA